MLRAIFEKESLILNKLGNDRAEVLAYHRFMNNPRIDESTLISNLTSRCARQVAGRRVLAIQDTTHVVMQHHAGLFSDDDPDLGHVGTGEEAGFLLHPVMVMDIEDCMALGFSDVKLWTRKGIKWGGGTKKEKGKRSAKAKIEQKESFRWVESAVKSREVLAEAQQVVVVGDRESDIYEFFCRVPNETTDILVRTSHNRAIEVAGQKQYLYPWLDARGVDATYELKVHTTRKRKSRTAQMQLKFAPVRILRSEKKWADDPKYKDLFIIEAKETPETVPEKEKPIHWRLYTTVKVSSPAEAMEVIEWYALRWQIEQLFRTLKSKGLQLEQSQLHTGHGLRILSLLGLEVALKIMQLTHVRDGKVNRPASLMFTPLQIKIIATLIPQKQGKTPKQQNNHPPESLAWAAWLIARLGGWTGYDSEPPGPITFREGLAVFNQMIEGFLALRGLDV